MRRFLILEETRRKKPKRTRKTDAGITPKELCRASELSLTEDAPYGDDDDWEDPLDAPYEDDSDWEEDEEPQSGWPLPVAARQVMAGDEFDFNGNKGREKWNEADAAPTLVPGPAAPTEATPAAATPTAAPPVPVSLYDYITRHGHLPNGGAV
jgi:hypothetical protein